ncbi:MAG: hypothetical protein HY321_12680 [Armatimonadetes bacterium]|nr:hypothetical protein [Armatimonadota bacterium]
MGSAYTPGLRVSPDIVIRKTRRLPLKGQVMVKVGDRVVPETPVARTELPGSAQVVRAAQTLGVEPRALAPLLRKRVGDALEKNELIGETKSFFGLFRTALNAPVAGTIEAISDTTGNITVREPPIPVEVPAYVRGIVVEVLPEEGVVVETRGALIQGIFGVGGERQGALRLVVSGPGEALDEDRVPADAAGQILVGGSLVTGGALRRAAEAGAAGIVAGGIIDRELVAYLGHDIGVAITGHEEIPLTLVITEGFGEIRMAERTFHLLRSLEGRQASVNGATQIRAGVIRPEVVVPLAEGEAAAAPTPQDEGLLEIGTRIRVIREPYFGRLGRVAALPPEPQPIPTDARVRVLEAELDTGERVLVPRANVEIIQE